jgi:hypothetical protein
MWLNERGFLGGLMNIEPMKLATGFGFATN